MRHSFIALSSTLLTPSAMELLLHLLCIPILLLISLYFLKPKTTTHQALTPYPILGYLPQFLKNRVRFRDWITDVLAVTPTATLTFRRLGGLNGIITANPANVEHILRSSFETYPKGPRVTSILHDFLGQGIFNADGPVWRHQRKTASFEFNTRSLRNFVLTTVQRETLSRLLPLLTNSAANGSFIDLQDVLERYAFDNVCQISFGVDPACLAEGEEGELASGFAQAFKDATTLSAGRFRYAIPNLWKIKRLLNIGSERRLREAIATINQFAIQIIRSRKKEIRNTSPAAEDLLSRFIAADAEEGSEEFLKDIVISFILAGRDTTSSALTWFFWLLSSRPDVECRIISEISSIREQRTTASGSSAAFTFEELREMQYLHAAITEAMRLYPPVPTNSTACMADDVLPDGTKVKKGWFVSYSSYAMGRMEAVWGADCREYRPERWLDASGVFLPESSFKFPVFHGGPRMCLGKEMAYIQMKSIAACMLERFEVDVKNKNTRPKQMVSLTLRTAGLPIRVTKRKTAVTALC